MVKLPISPNGQAVWLSHTFSCARKQDAAVTIIGSWSEVGFKAFSAFPKYKSCHCGHTDKLLMSPNGQGFLPVFI